MTEPALTIEQWIVTQPNYKNAPRDRESRSVYGTSRGIQRTTIGKSVMVRVRTKASAGVRPKEETIEIPAGSEVCIFRPFYLDGSGAPYAVRDHLNVATVFFPGGAGQVAVYTSLRSVVKIFSRL